MIAIIESGIPRTLHLNSIFIESQGLYQYG